MPGFPAAQAFAFVDGVLLPLALATIMLAIGMGLRPADFRRVLVARRALLIGVASMLLLVPAFGIALALAAAPTPALCFGLILLATCPSGMLSTLMTDMAHGDVALSIAISLVLSIAYVVLLPFVVDGAQAVLDIDGRGVLPRGEIMRKIIGFTALPVMIGMLLNHAASSQATRLAPLLKRGATLVLGCVLVTICYREQGLLRASFGAMLAIIAVMNLGNLAIALGVARLGRLRRAETASVAVEHLIRQEGTAIFVAVAVIGRPDAALPMIVNTFVAMLICGIMIGWRQRRVGTGPALHTHVVA